jgi:hypothetical protein
VSPNIPPNETQGVPILLARTHTHTQAIPLIASVVAPDTRSMKHAMPNFTTSCVKITVDPVIPGGVYRRVKAG